MIPAPKWLQRGGSGWPDGLEHLSNPPEGLWRWGNADFQKDAVAVVGSRKATPTGLDTARWVGRELAAAGVQVVSGMALGIDGAAHEGALNVGGSTVAVLGCGVDYCYPPRHRRLRDAIVETGMVISEDAGMVEPERWRFPRRNRIIAALCAAVIVVEADVRSGALSTARHAVDLGRDVFAVPGSIWSQQSAGTNRLIRDGAIPLLEMQDVFDVIAGVCRGDAETFHERQTPHP